MGDTRNCGDLFSLHRVVIELCEAGNGLARRAAPSGMRQPLPSRDVLIGIVESLRTVLFPGHFGSSEISDDSVAFHMGAILDGVASSLQIQIKRSLCFACESEVPECSECEQRASEITRRFLARLPEVRRLLASDVQAAYDGDPAATGPDEAILCYPGLMALTNFRLAHELYGLGVSLVPRMITEHAHSLTGIDIHPGATIGESFFMDHGTGIVIGETAEIGRRVRIYQGVTLGAKSFPLDTDGKPIKGILRHPLVEDDVIIYSGATILGRVTIGEGAVIGGNVWLTGDVPAGSRITQAQVEKARFEDGAGI